MAAHHSSLALRFGAELEIIAKSNTYAHKDFDAIAKEISSVLKVDNHVANIFDKEAEKYSEWSIIDELSITARRREFYHGVELVSPVLNFPEQNKWERQLQTVWTSLHRHFQITTTNQCSTHIHLSPSKGLWTLTQVQRISKAVIYFERSFDAIVPAHRRMNMWCRSNRWNHYFHRMTMPEAFKDIQAEQNMETLAAKMCWTSKDSPTGRLVEAPKDFKYSTFRWNFTNLLKNTGTIEFRQPPGSTDFNESKQWILLAVCFARWAAEYADQLEPHTIGTPERLASCILKGAGLCAVQNTDPIKQIFKNVKTLPVEPVHDLKDISDEGIKALKAKAKERDISLEKYKDLFGYK